MFKVVVRMMCALPMLTFAASDNSRTVIRQSVFRLFSIDVTADGPIVDFRPRPASSSRDCRPSVKRRYHLKTSARQTLFSPRVLFTSSYVSVGVLPKSLQNFMLARISKRSCDAIMRFKHA